MNQIDNPESCVGNRVRKTSDRPFKSTFKINTVKGVISHPTMGIPCFTFFEDDSYVEVRRCEIVNPDI